jgi:hypothetical protein
MARRVLARLLVARVARLARIVARALVTGVARLA